ncbi:glycoside hydrolase domain-containing protein [Desulfonema limicola]|uniref:Glycoside hydrolase domain-containing protein n=1 Tax=Desulfonema limicola TaxID=45656 RepID=A0A975GF39_9BACT|nr:S-layer homology domain-containing protein [Desulfonema limicola]QTA78779.1 glycoside hydrolase domain-containing protein [Desulfonema limicola]
MNQLSKRDYYKFFLVIVISLFHLFGTQDAFAVNLKLGVVYQLPDQKILEKGFAEMQPDIEKDIKDIVNTIAGGKNFTERINESNGEVIKLNLVIQTDAPWKYSHCQEEISKKDYQYLKDYAELLKTLNVKWTPVLGIADPPHWVESVYTNEPGGHAMPFPYESDAWNHTEKWVQGFIENLKEYIGVNNVIEEIFISNEMMFHPNSEIVRENYKDVDKGEKVKNLLIKLRRFVLEALNDQNKDIPVSWKFADITVASQENRELCGLTDETLAELFSHKGKDENGDPNSNYTKVDIIGLNLYEGLPKADCTNIATRQNDYQKVGFNGKIYFTEYNSLSQDKKDDQSEEQGLFDRGELKNCIITSYQNGGVYWTYFKWNGLPASPPHEGPIQQEQKDDLYEAFNELLVNATDKNQICKNFPDVEKGIWFCPYVEKLHLAGIVKGDDADGYYRPGRNVNRVEFLKMALEAEYGITLREKDEFKYELIENPFPDVPKAEWFAPYVAFAKNNGIVQVDGDDFLPGGEISRAEAVRILIHSFNITLNYKEGEKAVNEVFDDVQDINKDYYRYVYTGLEENIIEGYPDGFNCEMQQDGRKHFCPDKIINRAEAAKIVCIARYGENTCRNITCCDDK